MELTVSPAGRDHDPAARSNDNPGPFATIAGALAWRSSRRHTNATNTTPPTSAAGDADVIHIEAGRYEIGDTIRLDAGDSSDAAPLTLRGPATGEARLVAGKVIEQWQAVSDAAVLARLSPASREHVRCVDLHTIGLDDVGDIQPGGNKLELFVEGNRMPIARYPREGFMEIDSVFGEKPFASHGRDGDYVGRFAVKDAPLSRWVDEPDLWAHGYWFWDWADAYQQVAAIDVDANVIELQPPHHHYGYRKQQRFYLLNALCELNEPGQWALDRKAGLLYHWPLDAGAGQADAPVAEAIVSQLVTLIDANRTDHLRIERLSFEASRSHAIVVKDASHVVIAGCTIRNIGGYGVTITGGESCSVVGCDIHDTGEGGVNVSGGDRHSLTPCNHQVDNNHIHHFSQLVRTYRPAVLVAGVGVTVSHNLIHHAPHDAIQLSGNDHLIEYNELHSVCFETGDVGAFYMGRDWTARGTVIRHNYFHHIAGPGLHGAMAVYLDDSASGIAIEGNLFVLAGRAAFIGGGRDNTVEGNVFIDCQPAVHVDARGAGWMKNHVEPGGILPERLAEMPTHDQPWLAKYPELATLLDDEPGLPKGNVIHRNLCVGGVWKNIEKLAEPLVEFEGNVTGIAAAGVTFDGRTLTIPADAEPALLAIPPVPIDHIGLYADAARASWPVVHAEPLFVLKPESEVQTRSGAPG